MLCNSSTNFLGGIVDVKLDDFDGRQQSNGFESFDVEYVAKGWSPPVDISLDRLTVGICVLRVNAIMEMKVENDK